MTVLADDLALAQRYARPLFDQAKQSEAPDATLDQTLADLRLLSELGTQLPELAAFLSHPTTAIERKRALMEADVAPHLSPLGANLARLLLENGRMALLPAIKQALSDLIAQARREGEAWVTTAVALSDAQRERLAEAVCRRWGFQRAILHERLDPALLGGVVVRVGDSVVDGSFEERLMQLEKASG
ncbi:MAG: ATP synthase F1 subunit delta [Vampirovibrionales bacterium]|nr:ATP synthase F1 subunit delta [Vampirovibrionales bacterium]